MLQGLDQSGCSRIRFPRPHGGPFEAVLINTAGGLTGDDRLNWTVELGPAAHARLSTSAAEKLYRTAGPAARVHTEVQVGAQARLDWLPQETIVFDHSALQRELHVTMADSARLLLMETLVLGRQAMQEQVTHCNLHDLWHVRRGGRLLHTEAQQLQGPIESLRCRLAGIGRYNVMGTVLYCGPEPADTLDRFVAHIRRCDKRHTGLVSACSQWHGRLLIRTLAHTSWAYRQWLADGLQPLLGGASLPRVWSV